MVAELQATARARAGKGASRQVRREGNVPAVIYGNKKTPEMVAISANELKKLIGRGRFYSTVLDLKFDGKTERVLPRDVQLDPVMDFPVHVDFIRIGEDGRTRVSIPVNFLNRERCPGLKRGGALNIVRRFVEVYCPADRIPDHFDIDLGEVNIGTSIHISSVQLPEGATPVISDRDFTIATITGKGKKDADADAEEAEAAAAAPAKK